jgi:hypothetical protein
MHIDGNLIPLFALAVGLIITVTKILTESISRYKLKAEQIKADAMVRAEEVRSRNELELERLMRQDQANNADAVSNNSGRSMGSTAGNNTGNNTGTGFVLNNEEDYKTRSRVRE